MRRRAPRLVSLALMGLLGVSLAMPVPHAAAMPRSTPMVVGGVPADITDAPWAALLTDGRGGRCGASLVAPQWLLTAAHCVETAQGLRVVLGRTKVTGAGGIGVDRAVRHPDWRASAATADLALVRLTRPVPRSARVAPVALPRALDASAWPAAGTPAELTGWGSTTRGGRGSDLLRRARMSVLADPSAGDCGAYGAAFVPASHLCAGVASGGVDACTGDSGGGLTTIVGGRPVLAGVASAGNGCGRAAYPGVYTRVTTFLPWIETVIRT